MARLVDRIRHPSEVSLTRSVMRPLRERRVRAYSRNLVDRLATDITSAFNFYEIRELYTSLPTVLFLLR